MTGLLKGSSDVREAVTGAEYVRHITRFDSDRRARAAFQDLVLELAPPPALLFDFGAGTGIDARFFAERGFTVEAYDVDQKMCEYLATDCRELIAAGRIRLQTGAYEEFLQRDWHVDGAPIDLAVSNFAPFNLVDDLAALFAKLDRLTGPRAKVLASVLSPYYVAEMHRPWWWRRLLRLWRDGHYVVRGPCGAVRRHRLASFAAASAPYFRMSRVYRGLPPLRGWNTHGADPARPMAWLTGATSRFMFLLFEKPA